MSHEDYRRHYALTERRTNSIGGGGMSEEPFRGSAADLHEQNQKLKAEIEQLRDLIREAFNAGWDSREQHITTRRVKGREHVFTAWLDQKRSDGVRMLNTQPPQGHCLAERWYKDQEMNDHIKEASKITLNKPTERAYRRSAGNSHDRRKVRRAALRAYLDIQQLESDQWAFGFAMM